MVELRTLRVFTDRDGRYGNPLAVVLCGSNIPQQRRQMVTAELGYPELVFVNDVKRAEVRIFSPQTEFSFAGHPLVGTAWLLASEKEFPTVLRRPAGEVPTWIEEKVTWIRARPEWAPPWEQIQLDLAEDVDSMREPSSSRHDFTQFWAWQDEGRGVIRARVYANRVGVYEDEACGSASMLLAHRLGRSVTVRHGNGSLINARPGPDGTVEVGGTVVLDGTRQYDMADERRQRGP